MPKRQDLKSILIIGAGPIVIGQACEFDYSGAQACKALREEGYRVILVNSNPATIMTDPSMADSTYIEPITWQTVAKIIEKERPDAVLPTMGGQTALNCALALDANGVLEKFGVELIGATKEAIEKAEDRKLFDQAMRKIGLECPRASIAETMEQALEIQSRFGFPVIIRPSFTMGGSGGGIAYNREEFVEICERGFDLSPTHQLLIDESLIGWKEYEMEVVRDKNDNCIIICSIENFDAMGVHTGDSITVAPAQTLTDKEYQIMRNASIAVLREIGVETGGSNVQFGIDPKTGRMVVIEMNPRVSRSSALASKATGFPIAKVAAKLAVAVEALTVGGGLEPGVTVGPLIDDEAVLKVEAHVADALAGGARVLTGGRRHGAGARFYVPTVLVDVTPTMRIAREETFGPVAPLFRFRTEEEAIRMANDTEYGLAAYFYARDVGRVFRVGEALDYGMVGINTGLISTAEVPFGGVKQSGLGREGARQGVDDYVELKYLCLGDILK